MEGRGARGCREGGEAEDGVLLGSPGTGEKTLEHSDASEAKGRGWALGTSASPAVVQEGTSREPTPPPRQPWLCCFLTRRLGSQKKPHPGQQKTHEMTHHSQPPTLGLETK